MTRVQKKKKKGRVTLKGLINAIITKKKERVYSIVCVFGLRIWKVSERGHVVSASVKRVM